MKFTLILMLSFLFNPFLFSQLNNDTSSFSPDGPVIIYSDGKILNYSIIPGRSGFTVSQKEIKKSDLLTCYIDVINENFTFNLKENISTEQSVYPAPDKMLIISDIEGNFKGFKMILTGAGVIDNNYYWTFGKGHLVLPGDFFDRGINVTETLWLIYKLEAEAEAAGGKIHFILGNHEMMNLKGRLKYVRQKYIVNADSMKLDYNNWYTADTELGRWLRSKNAVEKIGDYIFVHGGISKNFPAEYDIEMISSQIRECMDKIYPEGTMSKDIFIGSDGPLWYRGIADMKETQEEVENTLKRFGAEKMIIGHTIISDSVSYLYNQKVIAIDLEHEENTAKGNMYALYFQNGNFYKIDNTGKISDLLP